MSRRKCLIIITHHYQKTSYFDKMIYMFILVLFNFVHGYIFCLEL